MLGVHDAVAEEFGQVSQAIHREVLNSVVNLSMFHVSHADSVSPAMIPSG